MKRGLLTLFLVLMPLRVFAINQKDLNAVNNDTIFYDDSDLCTAQAATTLNGDDNLAKVFNYLTSKGLNALQAAGVMGNLEQEDSTFDPTLLQHGGHSPEVIIDGVTGYGIAQWTSQGRQQALKDFANSQGKSSGDLGVQLDYLFMESNPGGGRPNAWPEQAKQTEIDPATLAWEQNYEAAGKPEMSNRYSYAEAILQRAGDLAGQQPPPSAPAQGTPASAPHQAVIFLDPGHGPENVTHDDGILDHEYDNEPEMHEVWSVAQAAKTKLEANGYKVVMSKNAIDEKLSLKDKAGRANAAKADLAVSIHDDHSQSWDSFAQIYEQKVGEHRDRPDGSQIAFTNNDVAAKSQQYGLIFQAERSASEGHNVQEVENSFDGRNGIAPGNIPLVELFATVPWVYNEVGAAPAGQSLPQDELDKYSQGIINGIEKSIGPDGGAGNAAKADACTASGTSGGSIVQVAQQELAKHPVEYDNDVLKYTDGHTEAWCADFVSWVYKTAGTPFTGGTSGGWRVPGSFIPGMATNVVWTSRSENKFPPAPGDFILVYSSVSTTSGVVDGRPVGHTGIVESVSGDKITTIEGNTSNTVGEHTYTNFILSGTTEEILGWGHLQ